MLHNIYSTRASVDKNSLFVYIYIFLVFVLFFYFLLNFHRFITQWDFFNPVSFIFYYVPLLFSLLFIPFLPFPPSPSSSLCIKSELNG